MRKITVLVFLFVSTLAWASATFSQDSSQTTIVASVTNLSDVIEYVAQDTVLQLVKLGKDGEYEFGSDSQGRMFFKSDLAKIPFPKKAKFTIIANNLTPGKYLIAAQLLKSQKVDPVLMKGNRDAVIEISKDLNSSKTVDLGDVRFKIK